MHAAKAFFYRYRYGIAVLVLALTVGFFYAGPPVMIQRNIEASGEEFVLSQYKTYRDSLQAYLPRAHEVYDGHFPPSELYATEQPPTIQNILPTAVFSSLMFLFQGNTDSAYIAAQFIFSGVIFMIAYLLGRALFISRLRAIFFSLMAVLTPIIVKLPFYKWQGLAEFQAFFLNNFIPFVNTQFDQLYLARIDEPLLTYPVYLLAILATYIFWRNPSRMAAIAAGVSAGLIFYTYFHHWVYWTIVVGLLFIAAWFLRKQDPARFKDYLMLLLALTITVIPYFATYFAFSHTGAAEDFIWREGIAPGRNFGFNANLLAEYLVYSALAVVAYLLYWKRDRLKAIWLGGLLAAMAAVWNVQLVIGYVPVPHFFRRSISPIIFIILFIFGYEIFSRLELRRPALKKIFIGALIILSVFLMAKKAINIIKISCCMQSHITDYYKFPSDVARSWRWMNENLPGEPVVVSPSTITSFYLTAHTAVRPYTPTAFTSLLSMREMEDRYLIAHKLFGVSEKTLRVRLEGKMDAGCAGYDCFPDKGSNLNDSFGNLYGNYFPSRYGSFDQYLSGADREIIGGKRAEKIEELLQRYGSLGADWADLGADYVYVGPLESQIGIRDLNLDPELKRIHRDNSVSIYKILR